MTEIIFIEGVSGVGKTTLAKALQERLQADGYAVKGYVESDFANPIDFYCTACVPGERRQNLCRRYPDQAARIRRCSIPAGEAFLVRYCDGDRPLFSGSLLDELREMEFCYNPPHPLPLADYAKICQTVWEGFDQSLDGLTDCFIFDGSLLHHPLNDLIRNYGASKEQAALHVEMLLNCLRKASASVFYLFTADIAGQLRLARQNRRQTPPDDRAVSFWQKRCEYDEYVLSHSVPACHLMNITQYGYAAIFEQIVSAARRTIYRS